MMCDEKGMFRLLLMLVIARCASTLSISHWDLEGANKTCEWISGCTQAKNSRIADNVDWKDRNCMCDQLCSRYGDCCTDSPHFDVDEQRRGSASYKCVELTQFGGIYMQTTCPPKWGDMAVRAACERASENQRDPVAGIPVTSNNTGITYRNMYCSICHDDHYDLHVWHPRIECDRVPYHLSRQDSQKLLAFDEKLSSWGIRLEGEFFSCEIDPVIPETAQHIVRRCLPNLIKTCAVKWTNVEVRSRCEAYTSVVYHASESYRNPHCAMCNNVPLQYLRCSMLLFRTHYNKEFSPIAFSVLFDLSGKQVGMVEPCGEHQLYDPFFKRCRSIVAELKRDKNTYLTDKDPHASQPVTELITNNSLSQNNCSKFILEKEEFVTENHSVYVPQYRKRFVEGDFLITDDGRLEICVGTLGLKNVDKFGIYMGYVTYAGLGVSIIFLVLHLTAFSLVSEMRNLSGKNLASLCVSLLVAYTTFMAGQVLEGIPCFIIAVITFYAFLASFMWMLTMAFDVWRTLRLATAELRVSAGKQWRKFFIYSAWSWSAPAVIVATAIWVQLTPADVPEDWRPEFAVYSCWFGRSKPLLVFFATPLAIIMGLNISFFASSAHMIYSTTSTTKFTASAGTQRDFRLYVRLAVVMGLTWTMGLIAGTLDVEALWYVFIALNTLQGLFIFLAFTCTDKVIRGLAVRHSDDKPLRPPSFSWSTDSTRRSHMGSDQATSDTLY
ncbi:uncharacterized protein LOC106663710 isoform X1 [Cimex lectularius]|uniref:G-protein coupled receptors family 2 profile 2 domain-containing protein n=2 Tax=Cimex lectularius TaxID=79782 RepID=A0A8I6RE64_CIMLE|nr:uncharacterized protein LOC106663710 isoform X1 [Cimex lectularius]